MRALLSRSIAMFENQLHEAKKLFSTVNGESLLELDDDMDNRESEDDDDELSDEDRDSDEDDNTDEDINTDSDKHFFTALEQV